MRLETRMEWCKWQMIFGQLDITQEDVQFSVDYKIPTEFKPTLTGADRWNQTTADPLDDMIEWNMLYRNEGIEVDFYQANLAVEKQLMQNTKIRTIRDTFFVGGANGANMMSREILGKIIMSYSGTPYQIYDKGYYFKMKLETPITTVSTSFIVSENPGVITGDIVTVVHKSGELAGTVRITVTPTGLSFAHAAIGGSVTYPAGSTVRIKKQFIPDNKFIVRGRLPPGTTGGQNWAEFVSTPSPYNGGLLNPTPGPFGKTVIDDDGDPPKCYVVSGIYGLPVLYHRTTNVIATVF
jgi:archaeosine-15-forming tRNA-guanine transglycosylase